MSSPIATISEWSHHAESLSCYSLEQKLPAHLDDVCLEANIVPEEVHRLLFAKATQEEKIAESAVIERAN
jgi:hypothetical protein